MTSVAIKVTEHRVSRKWSMHNGTRSLTEISWVLEVFGVEVLFEADLALLAR